MKAYKDKQYLVFEFEDGKNVKYDLSNGQTIGKSGKAVKSINSQLSGIDLLDVINSFDNPNYVNFLKFVNNKFINRSRIWDGYRYVDRGTCCKIRNIGTFLSRLKDYSYFEQIFASGIKVVSPDAKTKITDVPKGCLKILRDEGYKYDDNFIEKYSNNPDLFNWINETDFVSLTKSEIYEILVSRTYKCVRYAHLVVDYGYEQKQLIKYLDYLATYEAMDTSVLSEIEDYARMMSRISPKYDRHPKNFLTTHRIAIRNYNRLKQVFEEEHFKQNIKPHYEFTYENYKIIYPKCTQDIKDEATQQNHCVASYISRVIEGRTDILFLRLKDNLDESLVTLQVTDLRVVQAKGRFNRDLIPDELLVVEEYNKYLQKLLTK